MIRRRTVLKSVGSSVIAASTAGCFVFPGGGNGLRLESVDLTNHAAHQYGELSTEKVALVEAARANGEYVTYGHQPFTDGEYVEVDGTFYRVDVTKTGTKQLTRMVLGAHHVAEASDDAVSTDTYPEPDQRFVVIACRMALARERRDDDREEHEARYVVVFRMRSGDNSKILPEPEYPLVTYDDRTFRLWTEERELTEDEFRSEVTKIAEDADSFRQKVEDEYVIDLDDHDLSGEQEEIIETAIETGEYTESGSISSAFNVLINLLQEEEPRPRSLVKYEGEYYTWSYWHSD